MVVVAAAYSEGERMVAAWRWLLVIAVLNKGMQASELIVYFEKGKQDPMPFIA